MAASKGTMITVIQRIQKKRPDKFWPFPYCFGRGERIRTSGFYVPNVALYQAELHPEAFAYSASEQLRQTT